MSSKRSTKVRAAETIESLEMLNLNEDTITYVQKTIGYKKDYIVLRSRRLHQNAAIGKKLHKQEKLLVKAADEAGLIRHDLYPKTLNVWRLYRDMEPCLTGRYFFPDNKTYEELQAVSDEEYDAVLSTIQALPKEDSQILTAYYGLENDRPISEKAFAKKHNMNPVKVAQAKARALRRLRKPENLAKLPDKFGWEKRMFPDMAVYRGEKKAKLDARIESLIWSYSTYEILKSHHMDTFQSIYAISSKRLRSFGFSEESLVEIEKNMQLAGFDFSIDHESA